MSSPTAFPQIGDVFAGRYLIERVLGVSVGGGGGRASVVYGAHDRDRNRACAVRFRHGALAAEATHTEVDIEPSTGKVRVVGRFQHPTMLEVFDVGTDAGVSFVVMEWPDGESLKERLQRTGPLSIHDTAHLLVPCLRAMHEVHDAGVLHLDLKPANIWVCAGRDGGDEELRVLDFEIAEPAVDHGGAALVAPPALASPYYRAPEQLGRLDLDHRVDVYAFGAILYEMLTGRPPFAPNLPVGRASTPNAIASARLMPRTSTAQLLPVGVEPIIARAMARNVAERFASLAELADDFETYAATPRAGIVPYGSVALEAPRRHIERATPFEVEVPRRLPERRSPRSSRGSSLGQSEKWAYVVSAVWLVGCFSVLIVRYVESRRAADTVDVEYDAAEDPDLAVAPVTVERPIYVPAAQPAPVAPVSVITAPVATSRPVAEPPRAAPPEPPAAKEARMKSPPLPERANGEPPAPQPPREPVQNTAPARLSEPPPPLPLPSDPSREDVPDMKLL